MKIVKGYVLRHLSDQHIIIGEGVDQVKVNKMFIVNDSMSYLFENLVGKEFTVDDMVRLLLDEYEVTEDVAREDCIETINDWKANGIVK